jgi:hypothetical protein
MGDTTTDIVPDNRTIQFAQNRGQTFGLRCDTEIGVDWFVGISIAEQIDGYDLQAILDERWDDIPLEIAPSGDAVDQSNGGTVTEATVSDPFPAGTDVAWFADIVAHSCFPRSSPCPVSVDKLIGGVIQVIADDLRLRAYSQNIVADPDQRCFPAGSHGAEPIPCMTGDKAESGGFNPKLPLDVGVSLTRRLMVLNAVRAEAPLEKINNATMLKLTGLNLKQIDREREQPETGIAQLPECRWYLRMRRHRRKLLRKLLFIRPVDFDALRSVSIFITAAPISVNRK